PPRQKRLEKLPIPARRRLAPPLGLTQAMDHILQSTRGHGWVLGGGLSDLPLYCQEVPQRVPQFFGKIRDEDRGSNHSRLTLLEDYATLRPPTRAGALDAEPGGLRGPNRRIEPHRPPTAPIDASCPDGGPTVLCQLGREKQKFAKTLKNRSSARLVPFARV